MPQLPTGLWKVGLNSSFILILHVWSGEKQTTAHGDPRPGKSEITWLWKCEICEQPLTVARSGRCTVMLSLLDSGLNPICHLTKV